PWRRKHLDSLRQSYSPARFAEWALCALEPVYQRDWDNLFELDMAMTRVLMELLGLSREVVLASTLEVGGRRAERLIGICRAVGATHLYEGAAGRDYIDPHDFERAGIGLTFQNYEHQTYPQLHGP